MRNFSLSLTLAVAALVLACAGVDSPSAPPGAPSSARPAQPAGRGHHGRGGAPTAGGGGSADTPASRACRQLEACGVQAYDQCIGQANAVNDDVLWNCVASCSCAELQQGATRCTGGNGGGGGGGGANSCGRLTCSEGAAGDRYCADAGCGTCFWGHCTLF